MRKILLTVTLLAAFAFQMTAFANDATAAGELVVKDSAIALDIVDHAPVDVGESFDIYTEQLYCFTKIAGGGEGDFVEHVWRWGDKVMARVKLNVGGPMWRTHSSKRIIRVWTGAWTVDIVGPEGDVLDTLSFTITEPEKKYSEDEGADTGATDTGAADADTGESAAE